MMYDSSDRGLASIARATAMAVAIYFAVAPVMAADQPPTPSPAMMPAPAAAATTPSQESVTSSASGPTKSFSEDDVNKRVEEVVKERSKDGVFVFHDPKLDADLDLIMENIKGVRGMEGYGWFANVIFHDKDEAKKQYAIDVV